MAISSHPLSAIAISSNPQPKPPTGAALVDAGAFTPTLPMLGGPRTGVGTLNRAKGKSEFAIYSFVVNWGFEIQSVQPPNPVNVDKRQAASFSGATIGIEAKFVPPPSPNRWGQEPVLPIIPNSAARLQPGIGSTLKGEDIEGTYNRWINWWDSTLPVLTVQAKMTQPGIGSTLKGEDIEGRYSRWINWWDSTLPTLSNQRAQPNPGIGLTLKGDDIEGVLIRWYNFGWEIPPPLLSKAQLQGKAVPALSMRAGFVSFIPAPLEGWQQVQPWQPPATANLPRFKMAGTIAVGDPGNEAAYVPPVPQNLWGFDPVMPPLLLPPSRANASYMPRLPGWERPQVTSQWGFDPILPTLPNPKTDNNKSAGATLRGFEWNIERPSPWFNWADVQMQALSNARATPNPGIGLTLKGDDIEGPYVRWINDGWEQTASMPSGSQTRVHEFDMLWGDSGIENTFVIAPTVVGWSFDPTLPHLARTMKVGAAIKIKTEFAIYPNPFPEGWRIQDYQPQHVRYERSGSLARGEDGTEAKYFAVAPQVINMGFEGVWPQPPTRAGVHASGSIARGDDGNEGPINFYPAGWEVIPPQPPHPRPEKTGAIAKGDDGIQEVSGIITAAVIDWGYEYQPPTKIPPSRLISAATAKGDEGIGSPFASFYPYGWPVQPPQPPHPRPERAGAIEIGEPGVEAIYSLVAPQIVLMGFEGVWPQPPARPGVRALGSIAKGDDGTESPLANFYPAGWAVQPVQPPMYPQPEQRGAAIRIKSEFAVYPQPFPEGWQIQPPQPPHPRPERAGAVEVGEPGIEAIYFLQAPQIVFMGFEGVWPQPPAHGGVRASGTIAKGEEGTEWPLINFYPAGWEIMPPQPPHPRVEKSGMQFGGDSGVEYPEIVWVNQGWPIQPPQPPHPRPERAGSIARGDDGTESTFQFFTAPIILMGFEGVWPQPPHPRSERSGEQFGGDAGTEAPLVNWLNTGWEVAPHQPQHPRVEKWATLVGGDPGNERTLITWTVVGWEVQSYQPQHLRPERTGAIAKGDDGTENPFQFFTAPIINDGWEGTWPQPPHPRAEKWGTLAKGDEGTEGPYSIWINGGAWEIQPPQPPHPRPEKWASLTGSDQGDEAIEIKWYNSGWEIQSVQPPHPRPEKAGSIMPIEMGTEAQYSFIPPGFVTWGYEPTNYQTRVRYERAGSLMRGDDGVEGPYFNWINGGWEVQSYQPQHVRWEHWAALLYGDPGNEGIYAKWVNGGWEIQSVQPPHFGRERSGGWMPKDDGIEARFTFIPPPQLAFYQTPNPDTPLVRPGLTHSAIFAWEPPWGFSKYSVAVFYACSHITTMTATVSVSYATAQTMVKTESAKTAVTEATGESTVASPEGEMDVKGEGSTDPCKR